MKRQELQQSSNEQKNWPPGSRFKINLKGFKLFQLQYLVILNLETMYYVVTYKGKEDVELFDRLFDKRERKAGKKENK